MVHAVLMFPLSLCYFCFNFTMDVLSFPFYILRITKSHEIVVEYKTNKWFHSSQSFFAALEKKNEAGFDHIKLIIKAFESIFRKNAKCFRVRSIIESEV